MNRIVLPEWCSSRTQARKLNLPEDDKVVLVFTTTKATSQSYLDELTKMLNEHQYTYVQVEGSTERTRNLLEQSLRLRDFKFVLLFV